MRKRLTSLGTRSDVRRRPDDDGEEGAEE